MVVSWAALYTCIPRRSVSPPAMAPALSFYPRSRRGVSGKGRTDADARTSAHCEALERYSGLFRGTEPRVTSTFRELGERAIHPYACLNFSPAQYENRGRWNAVESTFNWIPEPFDEDVAVEWVAVSSLTGECRRYLPAAYCYYGYPGRAGHDFCRADSNGCAAGVTLEKAILSGFLELVERDSVALWWYNRAPRPGVDLAGLGDPYLRSVAEYYGRIGRRLGSRSHHDFRFR